LKRRRYMRYSQPEKMEIIRLVEQSPLSVKQTLFKLHINRSTFYQCSVSKESGQIQGMK